MLIRITAVAALALTAPALAQSGPAKNNAAIKSTHIVDNGGPRRGANSFTQGEARRHVATVAGSASRHASAGRECERRSLP